MLLLRSVILPGAGTLRNLRSARRAANNCRAVPVVCTMRVCVVAGESAGTSFVTYCEDDKFATRAPSRGPQPSYQTH